jgi:hypothetical protein
LAFTINHARVKMPGARKIDRSLARPIHWPCAWFCQPTNEDLETSGEAPARRLGRVP